MAQRTKFTMLPPELRAQVYDYMVLDHTTRRVRAVECEDVSNVDYSITTSAITATCRLVHDEYEDVARRAIAALEFVAVDLDFNHIIDYFRRHIDGRFLAILQSKEAVIQVRIVVHHHRRCRFETTEFYNWTLFLIRVKLEVEYRSDSASWMAIYRAMDAELAERCVIETDTAEVVRRNIDEIREIARAFDQAVWKAYPDFFAELQAERHREFDRRLDSASLEEAG